jgi:ribosomal 50S subunit-recycling heat shock protein
MSRGVSHSSESPASMRLDLFLKRSRVIPRRTVAHEICDHGCIWVNGSMAKGSRLVKVGDLIQWRQPGKVRSLKVSRIPSGDPGKKGAAGLYEMIVATPDAPPV